MASIGELKVVYSGGAGNTDQALSLGGVISASASGVVISQLSSVPSPAISGLTIIDARGHTSYGAGTVRWVSSSSQLLWKRPGGTAFIGIPISANGVYALGDASGYLIVSVVLASMPGASVDSTVDITPATNRTFDNISPLQSLSGYTDHRCFYIKNTAATGTAIDIKLWIKKQPDGADTLSLALDPAGLNGIALTIADEEDSGGVLAALPWAAPITQATALTIGNLVPGEYRALWVKRTVPADTFTQDINNRSSLAYSALV